MNDEMLPQLTCPRTDDPGIEWDKAPCPLCGDELYRPVLNATDNDRAGKGLRFDVVQCRSCELWYTNPRPSAASIGRFYADDYQPHRTMQHRFEKWSWLQDGMSCLLGRPCRERHFLPMVGQGRLLDFGCGNGKFLLRMREQGWQVTGLDLSAKVIQHLKREHGVPGHVGSLPHPDLTPGSFDVLTMWASLEHVHRPLEVLREAHRLLAPGGRIYVEVHNAGGWDRQMFGPHWFSLDLPRHLTHFSPNTLPKMLRSAGFRMRTLRHISHPSATKKSLRLAKAAGVVVPGHRLLDWKPTRLIWSWLAFVVGAGAHLFACAERSE